MKKTLICSALAMASIISAFSAHAELENSLSVGFAWSPLKVEGDFKSDTKNSDMVFKTKQDIDPMGISVKYRYELDPQLGIITSLSYLRNKQDLSSELANKDKSYNGRSEGSSNFYYISLLVGPTYRFNESVSVYAAAGVAYSKMTLKQSAKKSGGAAGPIKNQFENSENKTSPAGMIGFQVNPLPNMVIDASLEYAKMAGDKERFVWGIGLGTRF